MPTSDSGIGGWLTVARVVGDKLMAAYLLYKPRARKSVAMLSSSLVVLPYVCLYATPPCTMWLFARTGTTKTGSGGKCGGWITGRRGQGVLLQRTIPCAGGSEIMSVVFRPFVLSLFVVGRDEAWPVPAVQFFRVVEKA